MMWFCGKKFVLRQSRVLLEAKIEILQHICQIANWCLCTEGWLCIDESKNKFPSLYYVCLLKLCVCLCPLRLCSCQSAYKQGHLSQKWFKSVQVCFWPFLGHYQGRRPNFDTKFFWAKHNAKVSLYTNFH